MHYKKIYLYLVIVLIFIINSSFCFKPEAYINDTVYDVDKEVDIICINNFRGNLLNDKEETDAANLAMLISNRQKLKSDKYEAFVVASGNLYNNDSILQYTGGSIVSEFFKKIDIIASAIGSEEGAWSKDEINTVGGEGEFEFLAANIVDKESKSEVEWIKPYMIIESNGIKIGLIGITTEKILYKENIKDVNSIEFISPEVAVNKYARKLKIEENVNAVVVLSSLDVKRDKITGELTGQAVDLAKNIYNVDAIIAGSENEFIVDCASNIPIVLGGNSGKGVASLNFSFNKDGVLLKVEGNTKEVAETNKVINKDIEVMKIIEKYKGLLDKTLKVNMIPY